MITAIGLEEHACTPELRDALRPPSASASSPAYCLAAKARPARRPRRAPGQVANSPAVTGHRAGWLADSGTTRPA
jgi:hypothetical protein